MAGETDPLDDLSAAIQTFINAITDEPELLDNAIVVWESVSYADDGETQRCINYAAPTPNFSMSGALGLLDAGKQYVRRDALGIGRCDCRDES